MKSGVTSASAMRPRWASTSTRPRQRTPAAVSDINAPSAAATGAALGLGLGLIVAIGAQNAFFLRQGLRREHVIPVVALCALCHAVLMTAGVAGLAQLLGIWPALAWWLTAGDVAFLSAYSLRLLATRLVPG